MAKPKIKSTLYHVFRQRPLYAAKTLCKLMDLEAVERYKARLFKSHEPVDQHLSILPRTSNGVWDQAFPKKQKSEWYTLYNGDHVAITPIGPKFFKAYPNWNVPKKYLSR